MITAKCKDCGGTFRLDDSLAGKRVKCKRCGSIFTVPDPDPFTGDTDLFAIAGEDGMPSPPAAQVPDPDAPFASPDEAPMILNHAAAPEQRERARHSERDIITGPARSFWADAGMSFVIPFRGISLLMFAFVIVFKIIYAFLAFAFLLGMIGQAIIAGWLCAYYFQVIQSTCMGEDRLPRFDIGDPWEGMVLPGLQYIGTVVWAGLPFLVWSVLTYNLDILPGNGDTMVWFGLLGLAMFLWPMTILSVAIDGFSLDALRYDKQLLTIGRSFGRYAAIFVTLVLLVGLSTLAIGFGKIVGLTSMAAWIGLRGPLIVLDAYVSLTTMHLIGLFYRHNKHRFAWLAE